MLKQNTEKYGGNHATMTLSAPLAQLDRAAGFEPVGREFESLRARQCFPVPASSHLRQNLLLLQNSCTSMRTELDMFLLTLLWKPNLMTPAVDKLKT